MHFVSMGKAVRVIEYGYECISKEMDSRALLPPPFSSFAAGALALAIVRNTLVTHCAIRFFTFLFDIHCAENF